MSHTDRQSDPSLDQDPPQRDKITRGATAPDPAPVNDIYRNDDIYNNGALYDQIFPGPPDSGLFLAAQAQKTGDPILELACGTGILTLPLAARGYQITGLDNSSAMLAHARRKAASQPKTIPPIEWVQADMRAFDLNDPFRLIFLVHNSISALRTYQDFAACMDCVRQHLAPEGKFIVNTFMPDFTILQRAPGTRHPYRRYRDPTNRQEVLLLQENDYDPVHQILSTRIYRQTPGNPAQQMGELQLRIYFPQEFDALLQWNGFTIERKLGDYRGTPFGSGPHESRQTQLCICRVQT